MDGGGSSGCEMLRGLCSELQMLGQCGSHWGAWVAGIAGGDRARRFIDAAGGMVKKDEGVFEEQGLDEQALRG